jgi:hypothetical protein
MPDTDTEEKPAQPITSKVCDWCGCAIPEYRFLEHFIDCRDNVREVGS